MLKYFFNRTKTFMVLKTQNTTTSEVLIAKMQAKKMKSKELKEHHSQITGKYSAVWLPGYSVSCIVNTLLKKSNCVTMNISATKSETQKRGLILYQT